MNNTRTLFTAILMGITLFVISQLTGCGVTDWQREQDKRQAQHRQYYKALESMRNSLEEAEDRDFVRRVEEVKWVQW